VPATSTTGTFQVSWGSSGAGVVYELQEDTASTFANAQTVYTGMSQQYTVTGKNNGTYYYQVRASNGAGASSWTTDTTGCTVTLTPPTAPSAVTVPMSSSTGNYVVSWTSVTGAWAYDLEEDTSPSFTNPTQVYSGSTTSTSITGQADGIYYYRVRATNGAGQSGWTNGGNGCTVQRMVPGPIGFLTVPAASNTGNYSLVWGSVTSATLYELEEDTASDYSGAVQIYRGGSVNFQVTGRSSGTYYYRVRAVNPVGSSVWTVGGNPCVVTIMAAGTHVEPGPGNPGLTDELPGALGVPMLHMKVSAGMSEGIDVLSIRVSTSGTGDDTTELASVRLIRDVDGDGAEGAGDVQAGTGTFSADNGNIDFDTSAEPSVPAGGSMHYLVVCDFSGTAFTGSTFAFFVSVPGGVGCQGASSMSGVTPTGVGIPGGVKMIATSGTGSLAVSLGANGPVAGLVALGSTDVPLIQVRLSASSMEGVNVSGIKFASGGSGDESAGVTARLVQDNDGDGRVSGGDAALGTGVISGNDGTVEFTGLSLAVPSNGSVMLLVVYDFGGAPEGTYGVSLEVGQDIEALGNSSSMGITASGAPVAGPLVTLGVLPSASGDGATFFMGGCGAPVHPSPTGWLGLILLVISGVWLLAVKRSGAA
jgi:hypothetical protein